MSVLFCFGFFFDWLDIILEIAAIILSLLLLYCCLLFSSFFALSINFFVLPNNFVVSGVCSSSLCPFFILETNLLLILLIQIWIRGLVGNVSWFFYDVLDIILSIILKSTMLQVLFWLYCCYTVVFYFSRCNK